MLKNNWNESDKFQAFLVTFSNNSKKFGPKHDSGIDLLYILASVINKADVEDASKFLMLIQLDFKEPKTYKEAIN